MIIESPLGQIEGVEKDGVIAFRGIRYALAPTGDRRFCPPEPVPAWSHVYDAKTFGPAAPQLPPEQGPAEPTSEDCLFLNVYTGACDDKRRPVLFWIHGGGYVSGSGRFYNGRPFVSEHDVVIVTINYRMGALGFMHVGHLDPALSESVNNGILDQLCALQWTRDNITAFGGDPDNITIFGESAGGTSTAMILGCPRAEGMFDKAVVHSPHVDLIPVGKGNETFTNKIIQRLGGDPDTDGLETLRAASVEDLVAQNAGGSAVSSTKPTLGIRRPDKVSFSPAIDGTLIPRAIADTIRERGPNNPVFMGGGCRHEGTMFAGVAGAGDVSEQDAINIIDDEGFDGKKAVATYAIFAPGASPREKLTYALTDTMFRNSMVRLLNAAAESGATCYDWMCTFENDLTGMRATHAIELGFLWNWVEGLPEMAGSNPPKDLGPAMRALWVSFATNGVPNVEGEPSWPAYNTNDRPTMVLDAKREVINRLDDEVRRFWFEGQD